MCLKNSGGVWGGCLPILAVKKLAERFWRTVRGKNNNLSGGRNHKRAALVPKILARRKPHINAQVGSAVEGDPENFRRQNLVGIAEVSRGAG